MAHFEFEIPAQTEPPDCMFESPKVLPDDLKMAIFEMMGSFLLQLLLLRLGIKRPQGGGCKALNLLCYKSRKRIQKNEYEITAHVL